MLVVALFLCGELDDILAHSLAVHREPGRCSKRVRLELQSEREEHGVPKRLLYRNGAASAVDEESLEKQFRVKVGHHKGAANGLEHPLLLSRLQSAPACHGSNEPLNDGPQRRAISPAFPHSSRELNEVGVPLQAQESPRVLGQVAEELVGGNHHGPMNGQPGLLR